MSPVDRPGLIYALGSYEKFQVGFRDEKRPKILEMCVFWSRAATSSRIRPDFILLTGLNEMFIWQIFQPAYRYKKKIIM